LIRAISVLISFRFVPQVGMDCFFTIIKGSTIRGAGWGGGGRGGCWPLSLMFRFELGDPYLVEAWEEIFVLFRKQFKRILGGSSKELV
jgi:hypothetical protein